MICNMSEFIGLRAKAYAYKYGDHIDKRLKGIKIYVTRQSETANLRHLT